MGSIGNTNMKNNIYAKVSIQSSTPVLYTTTFTFILIPLSKVIKPNHRRSVFNHCIGNECQSFQIKVSITLFFKSIY